MYTGANVPVREQKCGEACEIDLRRDLFNNIVLSGGLASLFCAQRASGNTMFPGLAERLECELKAGANGETQCNQWLDESRTSLTNQL